MVIGMLFNRDAQEMFLDKGFVNLFITHPPYFGNLDIDYGGDMSLQIQNTLDPEIYYDRMMKSIKHMEHALAPDGSIFLMLPNNENAMTLLTKIGEHTGLSAGKLYVWDFSQMFPEEKEAHNVIIAHLYKNSFYYNDSYWIDHVFKLNWDTDHLNKYAGIAPPGAAFPISIAENLISRFSREGEIVGDLFGGTGTVALAAKRLKRKYVYNDISIDQYMLMQEILENE